MNSRTEAQRSDGETAQRSEGEKRQETEEEDSQELPSHHCLILNTSFEALKSARDSTQAMTSANLTMEKLANIEEEKNTRQCQELDEFAQFLSQVSESSHTKLPVQQESPDKNQLTWDK